MATSADPGLLERMVRAAVGAGRRTLEYYGTALEVQRKADESPVTAADRAAEAVILAHLAEAAPAIPVVAEEEVSAGRVPRVADRFFLVDPLDGTKEFVQQRGDYTVNVALVEDGMPVLGVVVAPARGWLFGGDVRARRAFRGDGLDPEGERRPIRIRPVPARGLTAVASRSHRTPETDAYLARYPVAELVSIGSSLKFCLVAAGEADLYPRLGPTMEWDTAAGHAVLLAAGGRVATLDGAPLRYGKPGFRNGDFVAFGAVQPPAA